MTKGIKVRKYLKTKSSDPFIRLAYYGASMPLGMALLIEGLRTKVGLTQAQLAKMAGVSLPMIGRLERGNLGRIPTLATINKVSRALGYEVGLVIPLVASKQ